ncbi:MAG: hypothetical protein LBV26_04710 [Bacteroidales bacterium]|jgi:hypothetical protein|nr:hypothetical protein [Bacteroidales bacterium]
MEIDKLKLINMTSNRHFQFGSEFNTLVTGGKLLKTPTVFVYPQNPMLVERPQE